MGPRVVSGVVVPCPGVRCAVTVVLGEGKGNERVPTESSVQGTGTGELDDATKTVRGTYIFSDWVETRRSSSGGETRD